MNKAREARNAYQREWATLNLESFNEILLGALEDESQQGKIELLKGELELCSQIFCEKVGQVLDELEETGYDSKLFRELNNIKDASVNIIEKLEELESQLEGEGE